MEIWMYRDGYQPKLCSFDALAADTGPLVDLWRSNLHFSCTFELPAVNDAGHIMSGGGGGAFTIPTIANVPELASGVLL
jgi:hypothetical protein